MNPKVFKLIVFLAVVLLMCMFNSCAENEPTAPEAAPKTLSTVITAGPADNEVLAFNSAATFTWDGDIRPGTITGFTYLFMEIDGATIDTLYMNTAMERLFSQKNLTTGNYRFAVYAHAEQDDEEIMDQTGAVRSFSVSPPLGTQPIVTIVQGPKQNSYASTGSHVFFEWSASDPTPGGSIASYAYALADSATPEGDLEWSEESPIITQIAFYNLANGTYRFWAKATNIGGVSAVASSDFVIKTADVLWAVDGPYTSGDLKFWRENVLRDFAYEEYHVSDKAGFISKLQSGQYSSVVWAWKNDWSALLDSAEFADVTAAGTVAEAAYDYAEGGGHLWIIGAEIMYGLDAGLDALDWQMVVEGTDTSYVTGPNTFARNVLHVTDWNEDDFQGCLRTGVGNYNDMVVDGNATFSWCDWTPPTTDAIAIYNFSSGALEGQPCAVRYPADAPNAGNTKVVYMAFYLTDTTQPAAMKASDVYQMATTLFTDFGENLD